MRQIYYLRRCFHVKLSFAFEQPKKMDYQPPSKRPKLPACVNCGILTDDRLCELCLILTECDRCHKRLHRDLFSTNLSTCLTCMNNRSRHRNYTFNDVFTVTAIPTDETCRDLEAYILGSSDLILEAIGQAIQQQRLDKRFVSYFFLMIKYRNCYKLLLFKLIYTIY